MAMAMWFEPGGPALRGHCTGPDVTLSSMAGGHYTFSCPIAKRTGAEGLGFPFSPLPFPTVTSSRAGLANLGPLTKPDHPECFCP